jgi:hypothetical protein
VAIGLTFLWTPREHAAKANGLPAQLPVSYEISHNPEFGARVGKGKIG